MSKSSLTRDEQYLVTLYRLANAKGDDFAEIDRYVVGQTLGQNNRSVDNIVQLLVQTNFIKKSENNIYLTPHGLSLVQSLLGN